MFSGILDHPTNDSTPLDEGGYQAKYVTRDSSALVIQYEVTPKATRYLNGRNSQYVESKPKETTQTKQT